jgi:tetratricopeptide (TPR) repeat protein
VAPRSATVADTLGWVYHLLGNDEEALRWLDAASRGLPSHAEVQLHAAVVYASLGRLQDAGRALKAAGTLDPSLRERTEFKDVQRKIGP